MVEVFKNTEIVTFGELLYEDSKTFIIHSSSIVFLKKDYNYKSKV